MRIADVAGGKGYLRSNLEEKGFSGVETWDKRFKHTAGKQIYRYFDYKTAPKYDAVIGMHPDEGTDHIIMYAGLNKVPAIICPCCVKPSAAMYWGNHKYKLWLEHLKKLAASLNLKVEEVKLKIVGRNDVLMLTP